MRALGISLSILHIYVTLLAPQSMKSQIYLAARVDEDKVGFVLFVLFFVGFCYGKDGTYFVGLIANIAKKRFFEKTPLLKLL